MHNYENYIGIDVSKATLDIVAVSEKKKIFTAKITNDPKALKALAKQLKKNGILLEKSLFCAEHTGVYTHHVLSWSAENKLSIWLESGMRIKKSLGIKREKTDEVDAYHIAMYAFRFEDQCKLWKAPIKAIKKLAVLSSLRERLVKEISQLSVPLKESKKFLLEEVTKEFEKHTNTGLKGLEKALKGTERSIQEVIEAHAELKEKYDLITSVKGIGHVTAVALIVFSNGFKNLHDARVIACYAGIAPFQYSSGTSIKGKTRVSHFANKKLKKLLHLAARTAMEHSPRMKAYKERKLKEGKHIMSIINAIRNKLLHIVCACVRTGQKYEENYTLKLA